MEIQFVMNPGRKMLRMRSTPNLNLTFQLVQYKINTLVST